MRRAGLAAAIFFVFISARSVAADDPSGCTDPGWAVLRQSACSTGSVVDPDAPSPRDATRLRIAWSHPFGGPVGNPIVQDGVVYVTSAGARPRLHALDLATGRSKWLSTNPHYGITGRLETDYANGLSPVIDGNVLLLHSLAGTLRRFDPRSGRVLWRRDRLSEDFLSPQVIADGNWYQDSGLGLSAYDAATGTRRWQSQELECWQCGVAALGGRVYAAGIAPQPTGGRASELDAFDAASGEVVWSAPGMFDDLGSPAIVDGLVLVPSSNAQPVKPGDYSKYLYTFAVQAFRASDGARVWSTPLGTSNGTWRSQLAADSSRVVYPDWGGDLDAVDTQTGKLAWRVHTGFTQSSPAIADGVVWIVDGSDRLSAFAESDGSPLWHSPRIAKLGISSPVVAGPYVLIGRPDGRLVAYEASGAPS